MPKAAKSWQEGQWGKGGWSAVEGGLKSVAEVLGFAEGGFIEKTKLETSEELFYPLELVLCKNCFTLQTNAVINSDILFFIYIL